jgi:hypothetical protein
MTRTVGKLYVAPGEIERRAEFIRSHDREHVIAAIAEHLRQINRSWSFTPYRTPQEWYAMPFGAK